MKMHLLVKTRYKGLVFWPLEDFLKGDCPGKPYVVNGHRHNLWGAFVPLHFV